MSKRASFESEYSSNDEEEDTKEKRNQTQLKNNGKGSQRNTEIKEWRATERVNVG